MGSPLKTSDHFLKTPYPFHHVDEFGNLLELVDLIYDV